MLALEELEARAGASDADRAVWLAERAAGVTATEVAKLANSGPGFARELALQKLGKSVPSFRGNKYTEWGKHREPVLVHMLACKGIEPESRVFHAADEPRYLASPDGVGVDFEGDIVLAECKTGKGDIRLWGSEFDTYGYYDQMQWQMRVTGAVGCWYVSEQHDDVWEPEPRPFPASVEWVARDLGRIEELEQVAIEFLALVDELRTDEGLSGPVTAMLAHLVEARQTAKAMLAHAEEELRLFVEAEGIEAAEVGGWKVTYSQGKPRRSFDTSAFKAKYPNQYEAFMKAGTAPKPSLRVTKVKEAQDG